MGEVMRNTFHYDIEVLQMILCCVSCNMVHFFAWTCVDVVDFLNMIMQTLMTDFSFDFLEWLYSFSSMPENMMCSLLIKSLWEQFSEYYGAPLNPLNCHATKALKQSCDVNLCKGRIHMNSTIQRLQEPGHITLPKNFKTPFF